MDKVGILAKNIPFVCLWSLDNRAFGDHGAPAPAPYYAQAQPSHDGNYHQGGHDNQYGEVKKEKKDKDKKKDGHGGMGAGGMVAAGVGGVVVGGIAGAMIANELGAYLFTPVHFWIQKLTLWQPILLRRRRMSRRKRSRRKRMTIKRDYVTIFKHGSFNTYPRRL